MAAPPEVMLELGSTHEEGSQEYYLWATTKRICIFGFALGTLAHMTCVLLSLAIADALAECARDSSVYRLFASGKDRIIRLCRLSFRVGCYADYVATLAATMNYMTWVEALIVFIVCILTSRCVQRFLVGDLAALDAVGDTSEFQLPKACFKHAAQTGRDLFTATHDNAEWRQLAAEVSARENRLASDGLGTQPASASRKKSWRTGRLALFG